jgi:hypothetical protein
LTRISESGQMTIDRSFLENFKALAPDAFDLNIPTDVETVFIDGQLKLQVPAGIYTWDVFFDCLFRKMIQRYLAMDSIKTVILAFDDSGNSPYAKGPTQAKRRSRSDVVVWSELTPLPPEIPANYATMLFNRNFKNRVIKYIVEQTTIQCRVNAGQRIIINYQNRPYVAVGVGSGGGLDENGEGETAVEFNVACALGECNTRSSRSRPVVEMYWFA